MRGVRRSLVLLAIGAIASAGLAQPSARVPSRAVVQPMGRDDGAELRRHLTILADNPRSLDALIGAGRAALRSGDPESAFSFFARADEISPRDPRIKAGMAAALVQLGRAQTALNLFHQAMSLGAPLGEIAAIAASPSTWSAPRAGRSRIMPQRCAIATMTRCDVGWRCRWRSAASAMRR